MNKRRFDRLMICSVVSMMLAVAPVTYGETVLDNEVTIEQQTKQLELKPELGDMLLEVGDTLDQQKLAEYVQFADGTSVTEADQLGVTFLKGDHLFEEGVAVDTGKARIRIYVETVDGEMLETQACLDILVKKVCIEEPDLTPDPIVTKYKPYIYGYPDGTFRPNRGVTREELASMVSRLILDGSTASHPHHFTDISEGRYSAANIGHLDALGIMQGYVDGTFHPHEQITRGEMAAVLERTIKALDAGVYERRVMDYADVDAQHWAYSSIRYVTEMGYMEGQVIGGETHFMPNEALTRSEAVQTLNKVFERICEGVELSNPYSDLTSGHWNYEGILCASIAHTHDKPAAD